MDVQTIERALQRPGKSKSGLAKALGIHNSAVTSLLRGKRRIQLHEVPKIEKYLGLADSVPIVGVVRAGAEAYFPEPANLGRARRIEGSGADTVAVEIQGNSLGAEFDGWVAYYDRRDDPPTAALLGHLCVVGLRDGRIMVKKLARSRHKDRFHLSSVNAETLFDQRVDWAARVIAIKPRDLAVIP